MLITVAVDAFIDLAHTRRSHASSEFESREEHDGDFPAIEVGSSSGQETTQSKIQVLTSPTHSARPHAFQSLRAVGEKMRNAPWKYG